jgi:ribonuclease VapC
VIFLDASAIVAMLTGEPEADELADRLASDPDRVTSAIAIFETVAALMRKREIGMTEARGVVEQFLEIGEIRLSPIGATEGDIALMAFDRFGKGRHPAALNLGDCFAYASAAAVGARLLSKGDDFPLTDVTPA